MLTSISTDETIDVILLFRAPGSCEAALRAHVGKLNVALEVNVVGEEGSGRNPSPVTETIFKGSLSESAAAVLLFPDDEQEQGQLCGGSHIYAVYKISVPLTRPRGRIHTPSIIISASASLKPDLPTEVNSKVSGYLQSGIPSSLNLLQSFADDAALNGVQPQLSALRVSRVAPLIGQQGLIKHVRAFPQLKLRIYPVLHARVRFSRPNTNPPSPNVLAILEIDFTPYFDCEILLNEIKLVMQGTIVQDLNQSPDLKLPLSLVSHDHIAFIYSLNPSPLDTTPRTQTRELDISMSATVQVIPNVCTPTLSVKWTSSIDFAPPLNPGYGLPSTGMGLNRSHKPSQLSISGGQAVTPLKSPSVTRPDALPALEASTTRTESDVPGLGITMSFTAPSGVIRPGDLFSWTVHIVNRATGKASRPPRKLALVVIPKSRRGETQSSNLASAQIKLRHLGIASAVIDNDFLHHSHENTLVGPTDVLCLSADSRIGPLAPGACHVVQLDFLALKPGVLGIESVRVKDIASQEHVDIKDLPTMLVEPIAS